MEKEYVAEFKLACSNYLSTVNLMILRAYGRELQLRNPTESKKPVLIQQILSVLCGETIPERSKAGAPVKYTYVDPKVVEMVEYLQKRYLYREVNVPYAVYIKNKSRKGVDPLKQIPVPEKDKEMKIVIPGNSEVINTPVSLQLAIDISCLNEEQKKLLNKFLKSVSSVCID